MIRALRTLLLIVLCASSPSLVWSQETEGVKVEAPRPQEDVTRKADTSHGDVRDTPPPAGNGDTTAKTDSEYDQKQNAAAHQKAELDAQLRSAKASEISATAAQRQVEIAEWQFWASIAAAAVAALGVVFVFQTYWETRRELALNFPPILTVVRISIWEKGDESRGRPMLKSGLEIEGEAWVFNAGARKAKVIHPIQAVCEFRQSGNLPMAAQLPYLYPSEETRLLRNGKPHNGIFDRGEDAYWRFATAVPQNPNGMTLWVMGEIRYVDATDKGGLIRNTAFARCYDISKGRFEPSDNRDYEAQI